MGEPILGGSQNLPRTLTSCPIASPSTVLLSRNLLSPIDGARRTGPTKSLPEDEELRHAYRRHLSPRHGGAHRKSRLALATQAGGRRLDPHKIETTAPAPATARALRGCAWQQPFREELTIYAQACYGVIKREAGASVTIGSDRELLGALGLSETQAADILDRTRQAVNAAFVAKRDRRGYFKPSDIILLRMAARAAGHDFDDQAVIGYVREVHKSAAAERVRSAFGMLAARPDLSTAEEAWVILPDFARLRSTSPDHAATIKGLAHDFPHTRLVYLSGSPFQEDALKDFVGMVGDNEGERVFFMSENIIGAQPTMLIANPRGHAPTVSLLVPAGFMTTPHLSGSLIASLLAKHVSELRGLPDLPGDEQAPAMPG